MKNGNVTDQDHKIDPYLDHPKTDNKIIIIQIIDVKTNI